MKNSSILSLIIICSFIVIGQTIKAQTYITAFKDGTAFVVKEENINASSGKHVITEIPQATFGTLWFWTYGNSILSTLGYETEVSESTQAKSIPEILKANLNQPSRITLVDDRNFDGMATQVEDNLIIFKTNAGTWLTLTPNQIKTAEIKVAPNVEFQKSEVKKVIELAFEQANANETLGMMYLQNGISWVPNYTIELGEDNIARLALRANLMNDGNDIENAYMNLAVGIPNFAYCYLESPLTSRQTMLNFITTLNQYSNSGGVDGYLNLNNRRSDITAQSMSNMILPGEMNGIDFNPTSVEGSEAEDLFFYKIDAVNLPKGSRGFYEVLKTESEYQDIYEVSLGGNTAYSYYTSEFTFSETINQVWHSIRLKNDSELPWTTGTVLLTKNINGITQPLSQDKLNYTPVGAKSKIKLTVASAIGVRDAEREINRIENKKRSGGYRYDLVTVEGKIEINNYSGKDVNLSIDRNILGKPLGCNEDWTTNKTFNQYDPLNQGYYTEWNVEVKAGKSKEIIYTYEIYVQK